MAAEQLADDGRHDESIAVLEFALEFEPDFSATYNTLATVQERAGRRSAALSNMEKALQRSPPQFRDFLQGEVARPRRP